MKKYYNFTSMDLLLTNCSNRYVLGTKCTSPDNLTGAYEKSFIWSVDRTMSDESFGKRISKENCPKVAKKILIFRDSF